LAPCGACDPCIGNHKSLHRRDALISSARAHRGTAQSLRLAPLGRGIYRLETDIPGCSLLAERRPPSSSVRRLAKSAALAGSSVQRTGVTSRTDLFDAHRPAGLLASQSSATLESQGSLRCDRRPFRSLVNRVLWNGHDTSQQWLEFAYWQDFGRWVEGRVVV